MSPLLQQILHQIKQLTPEEQLEVITEIAAHLKRQSQHLTKAKAQHKISEFRGMVQYPFFGEDAQIWISQTRQEADDHRNRLLRGNHAGE